MSKVLRFFSQGITFSQFKAISRFSSRCSDIRKRTFHCSTQLKSIEPKILQEPSIQKFIDDICGGNFPDHVTAKQRERIGSLVERRMEVKQNMVDLEELMREGQSDVELKVSAKAELDGCRYKLREVEEELMTTLMPEEEAPEMKELVLEVSPGVGGQEAMLFARSLFDMYVNYASFRNWECTVAQLDTTDLGGLRQATALLRGDDVFTRLKFESGVHRVQRVPSTDRSGRIHTSTVIVVVLPQPRDIDISLDERDLKIETKRASGAGGQHVNTTDSAVRITHLPTHTVVECQTERSQIKNKEIALKRLRAKLFDMENTSQNREIYQLRKLQAGTGARSDKVRTYNFNQDRITDHRFKTNFHNIEGFLEGEKLFDVAVDKMLQFYSDVLIEEFLRSIKQ